jgi:hypothetical protein
MVVAAGFTAAAGFIAAADLMAVAIAEFVAVSMAAPGLLAEEVATKAAGWELAAV